MKPRDKVVTAEDIQNSLYFVHAHHPEDSRLVESPPSFREPVYQESSSPLLSQPQSNPIHRKAIPGASVTPSVLAGPKRKPLPGTLTPVEDLQTRQNISAANYLQTSSNLLAPDYAPRRSFDSLQYRSENDRPSLSSRAPSSLPCPSGTSLTLIRRDPASGAQWNVARIDDPQVLDVTSSTLSDPSKKHAGAPLFVEITNPGYSKFLRSEPPNVPSLANGGRISSVVPPNPTNGPRVNVARPSQAMQAKEGNTFCRQVWMEGSRYPNGSFGHRRLDSYDSSAGSPRNSSEYLQYERSSMDSRPAETASFLLRDNQSYGTVQASNKQSTFRGYVFMSPWNGRCEFITGAGGGSLKVSAGLSVAN
jgi:hypothetical protein